MEKGNSVARAYFFCSKIEKAQLTSCEVVKPYPWFFAKIIVPFDGKMASPLVLGHIYIITSLGRFFKEKVKKPG